MNQNVTYELLSLLDALPIGIFLVDSDGIIKSASPMALAMIDVALENVVGYNIDVVLANSENDKEPLDLETLSQHSEFNLYKPNGEILPTLCKAVHLTLMGEERWVVTFIDISVRKEAEAAREELIAELQEALAHIKTLKGLVPICCVCKKVRDDSGYWQEVESYMRENTEAEFSHGYCEECAKKTLEEIKQPYSDEDLAKL